MRLPVLLHNESNLQNSPEPSSELNLSNGSYHQAWQRKRKVLMSNVCINLKTVIAFLSIVHASWHLWCLWCHMMSCDVMWHVHGYNASWQLSLCIKISSLALRSLAITVSYPDPMWHVDHFWNWDYYFSQALLLVLTRVHKNGRLE